MWYDFDTHVAYPGANVVNVSVDINKVGVELLDFLSTVGITFIAIF